MQQKKYNNKLTERMIQLAAEHGYAFDETDFSFVTVRDRIRCYYKSYVQSMKKKGKVIGYAARKAGLVTSEELEESAHTSGKIFVPTHWKDSGILFDQAAALLFLNLLICWHCKILVS